MSRPKISIIMPVYNTEKFLDESIKSILNQTFKDFEFIIVNDGSTDNSLKIIKKYMKQNKRIVLINNKKNIRVQKTLNKGLKKARGKYIARMDPDDISLPKRFDIQYNYLKSNPEIFLVGGSAIVIDENGRKFGVFKKYNNYRKIKKNLLKNNCIIHPSIMFRNEGFYYREKFKTSEDYDFYLRALSSGKNITNLEDFLIKYRITKNSFVSTMRNQNFYYTKAKQFYRQRTKYKKDDYNNLNPPRNNKIQKGSDFNKNYLRTKILVEFQDNQMRNMRKNIKLFLKKYGLEKRIIIYYMLSFLPYNLIKFMRKRI